MPVDLSLIPLSSGLGCGTDARMKILKLHALPALTPCGLHLDRDNNALPKRAKLPIRPIAR